jgi:hypothetical protein
MATPTHTPHGRGYQDSLLYFHHMNDYFDSTYENPSGVCGDMRPVDLWMSRSSDGYEGPAHGVNNPESRCNLGAPRVISDCHFRKTATECDRKTAIKRLSCTEK